jgi:hypothetical protein
VHSKKELHVVLRETKQKLRRPVKEKPHLNEEQKAQSIKDTAKMLEGFKRLLHTLEDPYKKLQIENYRRIIRTVERLHLRVLGKE